MLNSHYLVNEKSVRSFLMNTQDEKIGGFSKYEDSTPGIFFCYIYFGKYI